MVDTAYINHQLNHRPLYAKYFWLFPNTMKGILHTADLWSIAFVRIFLTKIW